MACSEFGIQITVAPDFLPETQEYNFSRFVRKVIYCMKRSLQDDIPRTADTTKRGCRRSRLPRDLLYHIAQFLSTDTLCVIGLVSREWLFATEPIWRDAHKAFIGSHTTRPVLGRKERWKYLYAGVRQGLMEQWRSPIGGLDPLWHWEGSVCVSFTLWGEYILINDARKFLALHPRTRKIRGSNTHTPCIYSRQSRTTYEDKVLITTSRSAAPLGLSDVQVGVYGAEEMTQGDVELTPHTQWNEHTLLVTGLTWHHGYAVSCSLDRTVKVWDLHRPHSLQTVTQTSVVHSLCAYGSVIYFGMGDGVVRCWDTRMQGATVSSFEAHQGITYCVHSNADLIVTGGSDARVTLWDTRMQRMVKYNTDTSAVFSVHCDGRHVITGNLRGQVKAWDFEDWQLLWQRCTPDPPLLHDDLRPVYCVATDDWRLYALCGQQLYSMDVG